MQFLLAANPLNDPNTKWFAVAFAGLAILYTVFRPTFGKKDPLNKPRSTAALAQQRNVERQMQNLLVELSEMSRQLTAQLDTRSQKLELLLHEADEKLAEMKRVIAALPASTNEPKMSESERAAWTIPSQPQPASVDQRHQEVYELADQGQAAADIARQLNRPRGEVELILALRRGDDWNDE
jgi:hypothetical protein